MTDGIGDECPVPAGVEPRAMDWYTGGRALSLQKACIRIGSQEQQRSIHCGEQAIEFTVQLEAGETELHAWFVDEDGQAVGAYYVYVAQLSQ